MYRVFHGIYIFLCKILFENFCTMLRSLEYQSGCKDIGSRKFDFVSRTNSFKILNKKLFWPKL